MELWFSGTLGAAGALAWVRLSLLAGALHRARAAGELRFLRLLIRPIPPVGQIPRLVALQLGPESFDAAADLLPSNDAQWVCRAVGRNYQALGLTPHQTVFVLDEILDRPLMRLGPGAGENPIAFVGSAPPLAGELEFLVRAALGAVEAVLFLLFCNFVRSVGRR